MRILYPTLIALSLTACATDADSDLDSTEQDVTSTGLTQLYSCSTNDQSSTNCTFNIASYDPSRTCVLAGVQGQLSGGGIADIQIHITGMVGGRFVGSYQLYLDPGPGTNRTIRASAICTTPYATTPSTGGSWEGGAATFIGNTPGLQCFLSEISNWTGFSHSTDSVRVFQVNNDWYIGGSLYSGENTFARATCFVPTGGSLWGYSYAWNNGTITAALAPNDPAGNGVACGLNKIEGAFTSLGDRISLGYDAGLAQWNVTLSGAHHAVESRCYN